MIIELFPRSLFTTIKIDIGLVPNIVKSNNGIMSASALKGFLYGATQVGSLDLKREPP